MAEAEVEAADALLADTRAAAHVAAAEAKAARKRADEAATIRVPPQGLELCSFATAPSKTSARVARVDSAARAARAL